MMEMKQADGLRGQEGLAASLNASETADSQPSSQLLSYLADVEAGP